MKIGFIGCGNMATAILKGILKSGEVAATDIIASAKSDKTREKIEKEAGELEKRYGYERTGCGICRCSISGSETAVPGRCSG